MELFDKIVDTFSKKIEYVRRASMGVPKTFTINLAVQVIDQTYHLSGNVYYVWSSPNETDYVGIKVNKSSEPALQCFRQTGLRTPYDKLLITTPAGQAGDMVILYGTESPDMLDIIDNRSATVAGISDILAELQGDLLPQSAAVEITVGIAQVQLLAASATRKAFSLCADINNTGDIYLGFDNTVTTPAGGNIWFDCMPPGKQFGIDDYRGSIHAIATAAGQLIGVGEW